MKPERLPSGNWRGIYRDTTGRRQYKTFPFEYQAQAWADDHEGSGAQPGASKIARITVKEYGDRWYRRLTGVSPGTLASYRTPLARVKDGSLGKLQMAELTRGDVKEWVAGMERDEVGPAARNYALKVLRMMVKTARVDEDPALLSSDPTEGIKRAKPLLKKRRSFLSADDVDDILEAAETLDWLNTPAGGRRVTLPAHGMLRLAILLGVDAGLRWEEIAALDLASVITAGNTTTLWVHRSADRKGRIRETTKNGEPREVPVTTDRLRKALRLRVKEARLEYGPDALLVSRPDGSPARYEHWQRVLLKGAMVKAGVEVPAVSGWHYLRHTYGSTLAEQGTPTKMISSLMGHADEDVTRLYMHDSSQAVLRAELERALVGR